MRGILATHVAFSHCYPPLIYYLTERSLFKKCPPTGKSLKKALIFCLQGPSVCFLHEVFGDCSAILTKNIAGSSGIELPILFASIESIDTFVRIDDFDTFSIVSPITSCHSDFYKFNSILTSIYGRITCLHAVIRKLNYTKLTARHLHWIALYQNTKPVVAYSRKLLLVRSEVRSFKRIKFTLEISIKTLPELILSITHTPYIGITSVCIHELAVRARQLDSLAQLVRALNRRAAGSIPARGPIYSCIFRNFHLQNTSVSSIE